MVSLIQRLGGDGCHSVLHTKQIGQCYLQNTTFMKKTERFNNLFDLGLTPTQAYFSYISRCEKTGQWEVETHNRRPHWRESPRSLRSASKLPDRATDAVRTRREWINSNIVIKYPFIRSRQFRKSVMFEDYEPVLWKPLNSYRWRRWLARQRGSFVPGASLPMWSWARIKCRLFHPRFKKMVSNEGSTVFWCLSQSHWAAFISIKNTWARRRLKPNQTV